MVLTVDQINAGLTFDQLIGSNITSDAYGSLVSSAAQRLDDSLNPRVPGGVSELVAMFNTPGKATQQVVDALVDALNNQASALNTQIQADLSVQQTIRDTSAAVDLATHILPANTTVPSTLFNLVATDTLKAIAATG